MFMSQLLLSDTGVHVVRVGYVNGVDCVFCRSQV